MAIWKYLGRVRWSCDEDLVTYEVTYPHIVIENDYIFPRGSRFEPDYRHRKIGPSRVVDGSGRTWFEKGLI